MIKTTIPYRNAFVYYPQPAVAPHVGALRTYGPLSSRKSISKINSPACSRTRIRVTPDPLNAGSIQARSAGRVRTHVRAHARAPSKHRATLRERASCKRAAPRRLYTPPQPGYVDGWVGGGGGGVIDWAAPWGCCRPLTAEPPRRRLPQAGFFAGRWRSWLYWRVAGVLMGGFWGCFSVGRGYRLCGR